MLRQSVERRTTDERSGLQMSWDRTLCVGLGQVEVEGLARRGRFMSRGFGRDWLWLSQLGCFLCSDWSTWRWSESHQISSWWHCWFLGVMNVPTMVRAVSSFQSTRGWAGVLRSVVPYWPPIIAIVTSDCSIIGPPRALKRENLEDGRDYDDRNGYFAARLCCGSWAFCTAERLV